MTEAIGPGRLILVVGPSGAGKDTLLARARAVLRDDKRVVFPRRAVTRPPNLAEDHDSLTEHEFALALEQGRFALAWDAHRLKYGIPASIDGDLRAGRTVVCNVSRAIVEEIRRRYQRVLVVLVTAPAELLAERLAARTRENRETITTRIARGDALAGFVSADFTISNAGSPEEAARDLIAIIRHGRADTDFPVELLL